MSDSASKTSVSYLQEYLVSKNLFPQYELICQKIGTHNPEFTFRVKVGVLWEEGVGRSKREAKQIAAEKMLRSLKVVDNNEEEISSEVSEESLNKATVIENYVGQLKEFCFNHRYPEPKYDLEEMGGPPHDRTFKMVCSVSKIQDFGISKTKQQAKHQAAFKVLQCLKKLEDKTSDEIKTLPDNPDVEWEKVLVAASMTNEQMAEQFKAYKLSNKVDIPDPVAFYKDHHNAYFYLLKMSSTLESIVTENKIHFENSKKLVMAVAKELGVTLQAIKVPSKENEIQFIIMTLLVNPSIAAAGKSVKEAAFKLLESLIILCT